MADIKISALPAASTLTGAETIPLVQGGVTKKVTTDRFARLTDAQRTAGAAGVVAALANGALMLPGGAVVGSAINHIGTAGSAGFGVGICPALPAGFTPLPGCTDPASANYGNYQFTDGSVMVWIPAFRFRLGNAADQGYSTYGANTIRIAPVSAHPDEATANAEGFYLHRAFINGGVTQSGFFRDKYDCSNNGSVASSIQGVQPMVSNPAAGQVGFAAVGAPNAYHGAFNAARTRGSKFHPETVFQADALCRLSDAHAQAATSTTYCAWYDSTGVRNYPKGNDNNALKSEADVLQSGAGAVTFTSAGNATYPAFALAGSGNQLAKTTHNGQLCGVTDVAGNIWKINPGMTCMAAAKAITGATRTNPVQLTIAAHGYATGRPAMINGVVGMTQLNHGVYKLTVIDANTVSLDGMDGTAFTAYTSGGSCTTGQFYVLKPSVDVATLTSGTTLATDHWGSTGVAANFDPIDLNFATNYPSNGFVQHFGNAANAVFDWSTPTGRALAMAGMPAAGGVSVVGSNLMGLDYFYQYFCDQLCVISRGSWGNGTNTGVRTRALYGHRTYPDVDVGFAASCYL